MKLGIVGAGLIVHTLLEFIHEVDVELIAISALPKDIEILNELKQKHGFKYVYTDYDEMLKNEEIDTIYIGVNNQLHYTFGKKALEANKHLIMEKPFTSNYEQARLIKRLAEEKHLMVFEAISTIHNPNFKKIKELLPAIGDIKIVTVNYTQYSSRYDAFLKGEILPAFDYTKSGGALMDLNIYNIHFLLALFGEPYKIRYIANMEHNIDTSGILTLEYHNFKCVSIAAKDCGAPYTNCIQGNKGCIYTHSPLFTLTDFDYQLNKEEPVRYDLTGDAHRMKHEFIDFLEMFNHKDYEKMNELLEHSLRVMKVVTEARKDIDLVFPDDFTL
ncbi:MAG: Gfo/Idh/MocA family oxidoreductase [Erysipelotrichaceae bacterium]|nr:Gfo/Idh/MocA family oxidoreductase [Erysipelotrichaceae bacterium]